MNPPQVLKGIAQTEPKRPYEGVEFVVSSVKPPKYLYMFCASYRVPAEVLEVDFTRRSCRIKYQAVGQSITEWVALSCVVATQRNEQAISAARVQMTTAMFRLSEVFERFGFSGLDARQDLVLLYECYYLSANRLEAKDLFLDYICDICAPRVDVPRHSVQFEGSLYKLRFSRELLELFAQTDRYFMLTQQGDSVSNEFTIFAYELGFYGEFIAEDFFRFLAQKCFESIVYNHGIAAEDTFRVYTLVNVALLSQLFVCVENLLDIFCADPAKYIEIKLRSFEELAFTKLVTEFVAKFKVPRYINHYFHESQLPYVRAYVDTISVCTDPQFLQFLSGKSYNGQKVLKLAQLYNWKTLTANTYCAQARNLALFLSFEAQYDLAPLREIYALAAKDFNANMSNQRQFIAEMQRETRLTALIAMYLQYVKQPSSALGCYNAFEAFFTQVQLLFYEHMAKIIYDTAANMQSIAYTQFQQCEKLILLLQNDAKTPDKLIEVVEQYNQLPNTLIYYKSHFCYLVDDVLDNSEQLQADLDIGSNAKQLFLLKKCYAEQMYHLATRKRLFSKFLLNLTDLMQNYLSYIELIVRDIMNLNHEAMEETDSAVFRRKYRWICTNIYYEEITLVFGEDAYAMNDFVAGVKTACGIDLTYLTAHAYERGENVNMDLVFEELIYLLQAFIYLSEVIVRWSAILKVECYLVMQPQAVWTRVEPITRILLGFKSLQAEFDQSLTQPLCRVKSDLMAESGENICRAIQIIKGAPQYSSWITYAEDCERYLREKMPIIMYLKMLNTDFVTEHTLYHIAQEAHHTLTRDRNTVCGELISKSVDYQDYRFNMMQRMYNEDLKNRNYLLHLQNIQHAMQEVKLRVADRRYGKLSEHGMTKIIEFVRLVDLDFNYYLYETQKIITSNPNIYVLRLARNVEFQLYYFFSFSMLISRCRNILDYMQEYYSMYFIKSTPGLRQLTSYFVEQLSQLASMYSKTANVYYYINNNYAVIKKLISALTSFDAQFERLYQVIDYDKIVDSVTAYFIGQVVVVGKQTVLKSNNEELALQANDVQNGVSLSQKSTLLIAEQHARQLIQQQKYDEYLLLPYQVINRTLQHFSETKIKEFAAFVKNADIDKTKRYAIAARINEHMCYQTAAEQLSLIKLYSRIDFPSISWVGDAKRVETYQLSRKYLHIAEEIVYLIKTKNMSVMLLDIINKYKSMDVLAIGHTISRILGYFFVVLSFSICDSNQHISMLLRKFLERNYIIYIIGLEYLTKDYLVTIQHTQSMLLNGRSALSQSDGAIILVLATQILNSHFEFNDSDLTKNVLKSFSNIYKVNISKDIYQSINDVAKEYAKQFTNIICCLSGFNCAYMLPSDVPYIIARTRQQTIQQIAVSAYEFLVMQTEDKTFHQSFEALVRSSFDVEGFVETLRSYWYVEPKKHEVLSSEGEFAFEMLQFYIRSGSVALLGHCQYLSQNFLYLLAVYNSWTVFWIFSQKDIDTQIKQIIKTGENALLAFVVYNENGSFAKSMYKNYINIHTTGQPLYLSNGQLIWLPSIRCALIMNSMKDLKLINSPFSLTQKRIIFKPSFYKFDFYYQQFIYYPFKLNKQFFKQKSYSQYDNYDVQSYNKYIHYLCHYYSATEVKYYYYQEKVVYHAMKIVNILIKGFIEKALELSKLVMDMRMWKIFRALLAIFYFVVGLARFDDYFEDSGQPADISEAESLELPLASYKLPQFSIENDRFMYFDFNFSSEFIQKRLQPDILYNAVSLAVFAGVVNTFLIVMVTVNNSSYDDCRNIFTSLKELFVKLNNEQYLKIPKFTFDFMQTFAFPENHFYYIALTTGQQVQHVKEEENSSYDDFADDAQNDKDELVYIYFEYGKHLLSNPTIKRMMYSDVNYELPLYYSPRYSMSVPFYSACIIACVPFVITGGEKSGKSTLIYAALGMLPQYLRCNHFTLSSRSNYKLVIDRIMQRLYMKSNCNFYAPYATCQVNWISMLDTNITGPRYDLDQYLLFLGEQLALASPSGFDTINFDNFYHSKYSGKTSVPTTAFVVEATEIPPYVASSQLLIFKINDLTEYDMVNFIKNIDHNLSDDEAQQFVMGINIILPFLPVSFYQLIATMKKCYIYTTDDDSSMKYLSLSLFLNALRALPNVYPKNVMTIMDQIYAALILKLLDKSSFWGGMSLDYMQELAKTDVTLFKQKYIYQYTKWELEVLSVAKEFADKYITTQTEYETEDEIENSSSGSDIAERSKKRSKPKLNILEAQGKFKKQMVLNSRLSSIEPGIFRLYASMYEQYCYAMDPTLCNRILIMHLNIYQYLERNAQKLHYFVQALRAADVDKITWFEDYFKIPAYIFYSFYMPSGYYNDEIQLLATLGNYLISNYSLFAQINAKRLDDEASLAESSTSFSDTASNSSSYSWASSSKSSALSSLASSHGFGEIEYQHNVHGRRQKRMLIDIMTLLQSVAKEQKNKQHYGKKRFDNYLTKALHYCIQMKGEIKAVGYAIRAAFCYSLGISPLLGLQDLHYDKNAKIIPGFSTLENYPFVDDIIEQFKEFLDFNPNVPTNVDVTMQKLMQYNILQEPIDILVVLPLSQLYSITDTSILVSVIQCVQQSSAVCDLFTEYEFQIISYLTAINFKVNAVLSPKQVLAFASRSFALAIVSDIYNVQNLLVPATPVGRHAVIEQRMNAYLSGELDRLKFYPLFKMTNIPLINLKKMRIPTTLLENEQQKQQFVESYCKSLLAIFQYCNDHCTKNYLNISLNTFGRVAVKIIHRRIRNNLKVINGVDSAKRILKQISHNYEYSPSDLQFALAVKGDLKQITEIMKQDFYRAASFIKNSITDGVMIAARLIYYPFIESALKDEYIFEISLAEALKLDRITTFSIKEASQVYLEAQYSNLQIANTSINISGLYSQLLGFLIEDLSEHWNFNQLIKQGEIQENYLQEVFCLISSKLLKIKFNFLNYNIAHQAVKIGELYYNGDSKISVIDCNLPYTQFCHDICNALLQKTSILFSNFASPDYPLENVVLIQKFSILLESRITHKNKSVSIGQMKVVLPKALHNYNVYYTLDQRVTFEFLVEQGIANQQLADQTVVIRPQFQVFNIYQNIFKTFGLQGRQHAYREICKKMALDFRTFTLPVEEQQLCLLNNMRNGLIMSRTYIDQLADLDEETKCLAVTTDQQQNDTKMLTAKLLDVLLYREKIYQHCIDNMQKVKYTNYVAYGMTSILLLLSHLSHVFTPLAVVFCDNFLEDFPKIINYKIYADANANVRLLLILNSLPFVLAKLLPMLPSEYKMPFAFMSYFYYSIPFGFSKYEDKYLLYHHFYTAQSYWQEASQKEIQMLLNNTNIDIHSAVFEHFPDLRDAWISLCSSHSFPRFMNWLHFFKENYSVLTKLCMSDSAFDTILGSYAYRMPNAFAPEVMAELNRRPLALPYDIQTPGNESIYSSLLLSMVLQKRNTEQIFARYHQIVPISPYTQLKYETEEFNMQYERFVRYFEASDITINDYPLRVTQLALLSRQKKNTVIVFYDEGMAMQIIISLCHKLTLQHLPPPIYTLKPTREEFQTNSVLVDTSADPDTVLAYLVAQFRSNNVPAHILWVLIHVEYGQKLGVSPISLLELSYLGAFANPVYGYFQRPKELIYGFSYSMMLANGLLIIHNLRVNTLPTEALRSVVFNCMEAAIQYSKDSAYDDAVLCFEVQKLIIMMYTNKLRELDTDIQLPQPTYNYVNRKRIPLEKEFEDLIFIPKTISYQDLLDKFDYLKRIKKSCPKSLISYPFRLLQYSNFYRILRDFINYIQISDIKYVYNDQLPIESDVQFNSMKYFSLIPEPMRHFMRFSLQGMHLECCKFTESNNFVVQMLDDVITMRGAAFYDVIGDMLEYLKLQYCELFSCNIDQLSIVGLLEKPQYLPIVYDDHIGFSDYKAQLIIGFSDFKILNAIYTNGYLEDYGDDHGYEQRYFIYFVAGFVYPQQDELEKHRYNQKLSFNTQTCEINDLVGISMNYRGYLGKVKVYVHGGGGNADHWKSKGVCIDIGYF